MRAVLVGAGNWGQKVAARAVDAGHTLVGVIDPDPEAQGRVAERYGVSAWRQPADLALICTPPHEGRPAQIRDLADTGIRRFHLAKPVCTTLDDLAELNGLDNEHTITVGFTTMYAPGASEFRQALSTMESPRVDFWRDSIPAPPHEADPLFDLGTHDLAQAMGVLGTTGWTVDKATADSERYDVSLRCGAASVGLRGGWGFDAKRRLAVASTPRLTVLFDDLGLRGTPTDMGDALTDELRHAGTAAGYGLELAGPVVRVLCEAKALARQAVAA